VAPHILGSTPRESELISQKLKGICAFSGRRHSCRRQGAYGDFVDLEDLSVQFLKMILIGFAYVCS
jgi:hypothetical protein